MAYFIRGLWRLNDTITEEGWAASADATKEYVNFTAYRSDDEPAYNYIGFNLQHYTSSTGTRDNLQFLKTTTTADIVYVWEKHSTATYELGWQNEVQRIVDFGGTLQVVSESFYNWFTANATRIDEKTKALCGVWRFNETITPTPFCSLDISFWSNGKRWAQLRRTNLTTTPDTQLGLVYRNSSTDKQDAYLFDEFNSMSIGWQSDAFRVVDFGATEQLVYEYDYKWLVANAKYLGENDAHPVYMDVDGERKQVTAYMDIDGERKKISTARRLLAAPTLSLDGDTLTITDDSKLATSFDILVDGEVKMEVPAKFSATEVTSDTSLTATINCCVGETIVAAIATRDTLAVSSGWTLISTSGINSVDTTKGQRLSWAYKVAESTTESITVTQASEQRLYINMIALSKGVSLVDNGYTYKNNTSGGKIAVNKPSGLVLWGMTTPNWLTSNPIWEASNGIYVVQLGTSTSSRLGIGYDSTDESEVTFDSGNNTTMIVGCLSVVGG